MDPREQFERRRSELKSDRSSYDAHWQEIKQYLLPEYGRFTSSNTPNGGKVRDHIINNTGGRATNTLSAGLMAGVTSPARPWFRLTTPDPELAAFEPVKAYLEDVRDAMLQLFARSNLYRSLPTAYRELAGFGTCCVFAREDEREGIRFYNTTVGEYMLGQSPRNIVDTVYRDFKLTVWQMVQRFGRKNVSPGVRSLYDRGKYHTLFDVTHVIEPNQEPIEGLGDTVLNRAWRSVYYERGANKDALLSVGGFDEFPAMAPRWEVVSSDVYGFGPGHESLGDVKELQHHEKMKMEAIEKTTRPPMMADSQFRNVPVNTLPNGITWYDAATTQRPGLQPLYQINFPLQFALQAINDVETRIKEAFYVDLFRMITELDRRQITAREIDERREEKLLMLGPVLERLNDELLDPLIDRTYAVMNRKGLLPPPPEELIGVDLRVEYISVLAQAQKRIGTASIDQLYAFAGQLSQMKGDSSPMDKLDDDRAIDHYADMLGTNADVLIAQDEVDAARQQRAQLEQASQAADLASSAASTAKTLSETEGESGNALDSILSAAGVTNG